MVIILAGQVGPVLLTILGIMSIHCIVLLIHSCQVLCKRLVFYIKTAVCYFIAKI